MLNPHTRDDRRAQSPPRWRGRLARHRPPTWLTRTVILLTISTFVAGVTGPGDPHAAAAVPPAGCQSAALTAPDARAALRVAALRAEVTVQSLHPGAYPAVTTRAGNWVTTGRGYWTSGFFPGTLWLLSEQTHDPGLRRAAATWTAPLAPQAEVTRSHDVGFEILSSFGNGFDAAPSPDYRAVLRQAAASLATRYSPTVGAIRSWGRRDGTRHFKVIADGLMNAELLFWAAAHGGPARWAQIAARSDLTTLRNLVRPDGSVVHLADFDPRTGRLLRLRNPQGYDLSSTWSRGQAWAIAGFTIAYRATGDPRFLEAARATSGYFISHLPRDCVPYWDFDAPGIPNAPRDSSAAAIAADYLLELGALEPVRPRAAADVRAATRILGSLRMSFIAADGPAVLERGTADEALGRYDIGTSYGDYYFVAALERFLRAATSA